MGNDAAQLVTALISGLGVLVFGGHLAFYFWARDDASASSARARPWRVLGASICLLLSVMFYIGVNHLDGKAHPGMFLAFWILMLLLTGWVCVLAMKDVMHTRREYLERRGQKGAGQLHTTSPPGPQEPEDRGG